ncbi:protein YIPF7-like [Adelges cooleyi]|uniref:protein YIPF7-like n=1 Tax=Adelges cooleyi TaxID=133065 RepID=UPI0021807DB6|nr:protein YIPF7-like [Adelges cooleyi]
MVNLEFMNVTPTNHDEVVPVLEPYVDGILSIRSEQAQAQSVDNDNYYNDGFADAEEPPLLEELGVDVDKICARLLRSLDPTGKREAILADFDPVGPVAVYVAYTALVFVARGKFVFGHVYGLSVLTALGVYGLLWALTGSSRVTVTAVFTVLGYSFAPSVLVALAAVFVRLDNVFGALVVLAAVLWSGSNASAEFVATYGNVDQKHLITYPCAVAYCLHLLLVLF